MKPGVSSSSGPREPTWADRGGCEWPRLRGTVPLIEEQLPCFHVTGKLQTALEQRSSGANKLKSANTGFLSPLGNTKRPHKKELEPVEGFPTPRPAVPRSPETSVTWTHRDGSTTAGRSAPDAEISTFVSTSRFITHPWAHSARGSRHLGIRPCVLLKKQAPAVLVPEQVSTRLQSSAAGVPPPGRGCRRGWASQAMNILCGPGTLGMLEMMPPETAAMSNL